MNAMTPYNFVEQVARRILDILVTRKAMLHQAGVVFYVWQRAGRIVVAFDPDAIEIKKVNEDFAHELSTRLHGRLVVGTAIPLQDPGKLPIVEARLFKGDELKDRGVGANVLGSPLTSLGYLVELLQKQPDAQPLRAGEIITTGVLTDAHPVAPGETWRTEIAGLPLKGLTITFR